MNAQPDSTAPIYCRGCCYRLDHLEVRKCPDCGREFDPDNASTYSLKPVNTDRRARIGRLSYLAATITLICGIYCVIGMALGDLGYEWTAKALAAYGIAALIGLPLTLVAAVWNVEEQADLRVRSLCFHLTALVIAVAAFMYVLSAGAR